MLSFDLNYDSTNKLFFPTQGIEKSISFTFSPEGISDNSYYKLLLNNKMYKDVKTQIIIFF